MTYLRWNRSHELITPSKRQKWRMENFNLIVSPTGQTRKGVLICFACKDKLFMSICDTSEETRNSVDLIFVWNECIDWNNKVTFYSLTKICQLMMIYSNILLYATHELMLKIKILEISNTAAFIVKYSEVYIWRNEHISWCVSGN